MEGDDEPKNNPVLDKLVEKSLFTKRQVEIIINEMDPDKPRPATITSGAYYRQVGQSREKLRGVYYSVVLLRVLGVILPSDVDVMDGVCDKLSLLYQNPNITQNMDQVLDVVERVFDQASYIRKTPNNM